MSTVPASALDQLFREARTIKAWLDQPVSDDTLREIYDLAKWGPTSFNTSPARFVFIRTREGKERLRPALTPGNVEKMMTAPVTVIVAYDLLFHQTMGRLSNKPSMQTMFESDPRFAEVTALRNSSLQGAYFMLAARAVGLDCGPMSGFDNAKVDEEFFPQGHLRSNFLCNLGYGDRSKVQPRNPRLDFHEACTLL